MPDGLLVTATLLVLATGAALAIVASPRGTTTRTGLVLAAFALAAFGHARLVDTLGLPTTLELPADAELVASHVVEPEAAGGRGGAITLWLLTEGSTRPRAHELAYDRALHERLHAVQQPDDGDGTRAGRLLVTVRSRADGSPAVEVRAAGVRRLPPKANAGS